jgi:hypothetical protein
MNINTFMALIVFSLPLYSATLIGNWQTQCFKATQPPTQLKMSFDGPYLKYEKTLFKSEKCQVGTQEYIWMATHEVYKEDQQDQYWKIDFILEGVYLRSLTDEQTDSFNKTKHCGFTDWETGSLKEVTGKWCGDNQFGPKGFKAFNVLSQGSNTMKIDLEASAPSVVQRPKIPGEITYSANP